MPNLIDVDEISTMSDQPWTKQQRKRAEILLEGIEGWIERKAPCLGPAGNPTAGARSEAREVIASAVLRAIGSGTGNAASQSQTIGPDTLSTTFVDRAGKNTLTAGDEARLIALCPAKRRRQRFGVIKTRPGY